MDMTTLRPTDWASVEAAMICAGQSYMAEKMLVKIYLELKKANALQIYAINLGLEQDMINAALNTTRLNQLKSISAQFNLDFKM